MTEETFSGTFSVTQQMIDTYAAEGAVMISQPFSSACIDGLAAAFDEIQAEHAAGAYLGDVFVQSSRLEITGAVGGHPFIRRWALESQAAEIAARVMGSRFSRLYSPQDVAFGKRGVPDEAQVGATSFHVDGSAWGFIGRQIASFWLALTDVGYDYGPLVSAVGSHLKLKKLILPSPIDPNRSMPEGYAPYSTMQSFLDEHQFEMRVHPARRGDVVMLHPHVVHGSLPMRRAGDRLAFSTRWLGEDARWHINPLVHQVPGTSDLDIEEGAPPPDSKYPVIWSEREGNRGRAPGVAEIHTIKTALPPLRYQESSRVETQKYVP
jgi:ectoine hydroxylase-related dioxygenase (phytanoyl-CoA dioxygenase family)